MEMKEKIRSWIRKYIPTPALILFILFLCCVPLQIAFRLFPGFADFYNRYIGGVLRILLAKAPDWIPFSLAEALLYFFVLVCILAAANTIFALNFSAGYHGEPLAAKLQLEDRAVTAQELYDTITIVIGHVNETSEKVLLQEDGSSTMPWNVFTLSDVLCDAYQPLYAKYAFLTPMDSNIKPLVISPLMTYTHISGIYSFYTGEANLNTNYPDYVCAYSAAHELAHQRGIAREDEANFIAFLVCTESEDPYLQYSGYLSMYSYLSSALYQADPALHKQAASSLGDTAKRELAAYSVFFEKYRDNAAATVSDTVNDAYLQSQGTAGSVSYGMVVDLAVS